MSILRRVSVLLAGVGLLTGGLQAAVKPSAEEHYLPVLQLGTRTYSNVTVTTKNKDYIFILHSRGMNNIKVADLSQELKEQFGYAVAPRKPATNVAEAWAKQTFAKMETPQVKAIEAQLQQRLGGKSAIESRLKFLRGPQILLVLGAILLFLHLFWSWCCMLICKKAGHEPGILVWIPVLQVFPLLKAAGMSGWWFLALLVPVLNIVAQILWCFRIAAARGKGVVTAVFLILPFTNFFAFLYLAFSNGGPEKEDKRIEIMTLETA